MYKYLPSLRFWKRKWKESLILFILALGLYAVSWSFDHTLDDIIVIVENDYTKKGFSGIWELLTTESFQGYFGKQMDLLVGARYRPLSLVTFAIEYQFFGLSPTVGHVVNTLLYAFTGLLLFRFLSFSFPSLKKGQWYLGLAFIASLLFVLHPIHSEAVANIKGRDELLSFMFSIASFYYVIRYVKKGEKLGLIFASLLFFLGLMSKENTITYLAVIPIGAYFISKPKAITLATILGILILPTILYLLIRYQVIGYLLNVDKQVADLMNNPFVGMDIGEKYATIAYTLLEYLRLLIFPHPLTHDYYPYHVPIMNWQMISPWLSSLIYTALGIWALISFRKKNLYGLCIILYLAPLSIVSNIFFGVGTFMNERFVYMSSLGFCLALSYFLTRHIPKLLGGEKEKFYPIPGLILLACLVLFGIKTALRVPIWQNKLSLNTAGVQVSENSARANCFMSTAIFEEFKRQKDAGAPSDELKKMLLDVDSYAEKSTSIHPPYKNALIMKTGAAAELHKIDGDLPKLLSSFYDIRKVRRIEFIDTYLEYLNDREDSQLLNDFYYRLSIEEFAKKQRDYNTAVKYLQYGYDIDRKDPKILKGLCMVYGFAENYSRSIAYGQEALNLTPEDGELLYHLGVSYAGVGDELRSKQLLEKSKAILSN